MYLGCLGSLRCLGGVGGWWSFVPPSTKGARLMLGVVVFFSNIYFDRFMLTSPSLSSPRLAVVETLGDFSPVVVAVLACLCSGIVGVSTRRRCCIGLPL